MNVKNESERDSCNPFSLSRSLFSLFANLTTFDISCIFADCMKHILLLGAGRSASYLIKYLLDNSSSQNWKVTVADVSLELAKQKVGNHPNAVVNAFDVNDEKHRENEIAKTDLVISLLPAHLHYLVAKDCVRLKKHLVTASYVSNEIRQLDVEAKKNGVLLLNEIGLDPGIDHMSAMQIIDHIRNEGGEINSFKSYCGGLIAPESNNNPWGYKFTWNPRNVVLAGQGTAQYIENGKYKEIPYSRLFLETEKIKVEGCGEFEAYANRDSLSNREPYGLQNIPTMLRGTLRSSGFCKAWNAFVQLGWTDDSYKIANSEQMTYKEFLKTYLRSPLSGKQQLADLLGESENSEVMKKLDWLEIFNNEKINLQNATPAQILQKFLEEKWKLEPTDIDMIVMQHQFEYASPSSPLPMERGVRQDGVRENISSLVVKGEDSIYTAMAKTVGLPVGIAAKLILNNVIKVRGVQIPTMKEIYEPVLKELEMFGIKFREKIQNAG